MHSLIHVEHARTHATGRLERASGRPPRPSRPDPPPLRRHVAHLAARFATRVDAETARRAVA